MFLASLIKEKRIKLNSTKIVFLMGDRNLFSSEKTILLDPSPFNLKENWQPPATLPTNEMELAEFAWDQLDLPLELKNQKPIFIKAAKKQDASRADTEDCVREFVENNPMPKGSILLIVSSNPFVYYQKAVTKLMFDRLGHSTKDLQFEGTDPEFNIEKYDNVTSIGLLLDNLARVLYTETQSQHSL